MFLSYTHLRARTVIRDSHISRRRFGAVRVQNADGGGGLPAPGKQLPSHPAVTSVGGARCIIKDEHPGTPRVRPDVRLTSGAVRDRVARPLEPAVADGQNFTPRSWRSSSTRSRPRLLMILMPVALIRSLTLRPRPGDQQPLVLRVRIAATLRLVVGVRGGVARHRALAGDYANTCHLSLRVPWGVESRRGERSLAQMQ